MEKEEKDKVISYSCVVRFSVIEDGKKRKVEARIDVSFKAKKKV